MKLRTEISIKPFPWRIDHKARILCMGSCFADRIGQRMLGSKFRTQINPAGIAYNPISLARLLTAARTLEYSLADDIFQHEDRWHSFDFHTSMSDPHPERMKENIESTLGFMRSYLKQTEVVVLTFGTAFGFALHESGRIVNNCHKLPNALFEKQLLDLQTCVNALSKEIAGLRELNPNLKFILTVSPVRHTNEGLAENNLSKSILRVMCDQLATSHENVEYFPAYEIMTDDLRDYRFYGDDLIHPTPFAEEYIWEKFAFAAFDKETLKLIAEWDRAQKALNHRPFNPHGEPYRQHLETLLTKMEELNLLLDVEEEMEAVREKLATL